MSVCTSLFVEQLREFSTEARMVTSRRITREATELLASFTLRKKPNGPSGHGQNSAEA